VSARLDPVSTSSRLTAGDIEGVSIPGKQVELIQGKLVVREPPGTRHGVIAATLAHYVSAFVRRHALGIVVAQNTGFRIASDPDTVRGPDVGFVASDRAKRIHPRGYADVAPNLVAEILSPDDVPGEVIGKIGEWLAAGTRLAWLIDPRRLEIHVYHADGRLTVLHEGDELSGEDVLPGFTCAVKDVFA
jgi:Uma2 family endonuclease